MTNKQDDLKSVNRFAAQANNKLDFARKVTEQRLSNCDVEEELVTLYSTLVDEENFELNEEDDCLTIKSDFLVNVEEKITERGEHPHEKEILENIKNKILEKVKSKKIERKSRRESIGNLRRDSCSNLKRERGSSGGDSSCSKKET